MLRLVCSGVLLAFWGTAHAQENAWSADGENLVFWTDWDGNLEVYSVAMDNGVLTNLTQHESEDANPVFSPDGTRISFYSKRDGNGEIYVMDADGGNPVNLTRHSAQDFNPSWAPDGSQIAFQSYRDGLAQIYVMNADGSEQVRLYPEEHAQSNAAFSPDGKRMAFVSDRSGMAEIYTMPADGGEIRSLVSDPEWAFYNPKWSPDGSRLVLHSLKKLGVRELGSIYVLEMESGDLDQLTESDGYDFNPFFSPDGKRIAFNAYRKGQMGIYVMNADGSDERLITLGPVVTK